MKTINIQLFNEQHTIKCSDDEVDTLKAAALLLNNKMIDAKNRFKQLDTKQSLLLASLAIAAEYTMAQDKHEGNLAQMSRIIERLEARIQDTLTSA